MVQTAPAHRVAEAEVIVFANRPRPARLTGASKQLRSSVAGLAVFGPVVETAAAHRVAESEVIVFANRPRLAAYGAFYWFLLPGSPSAPGRVIRHQRGRQKEAHGRAREARGR
ncbi:hypothetical protein JCM30394_28940 [Deferrisoma palaeochoriense]